MSERCRRYALVEGQIVSTAWVKVVSRPRTSVGERKEGRKEKEEDENYGHQRLEGNSSMEGDGELKAG